jgi:hypothetical protein
MENRSLIVHDLVERRTWRDLPEMQGLPRMAVSRPWVAWVAPTPATDQGPPLGGGKDLRLLDMRTGSVTTVHQSSQFSEPTLDGSALVWGAKDGDRTLLHRLDLESGQAQEQVIPTMLALDRTWRVGETWVWHQNFRESLYAWDGGSAPPRMLAKEAGSAAVAAGRVAWIDGPAVTAPSAPTNRIVLWNVGTGEEKVLHPPDGRFMQFDIDRCWIGWQHLHAEDEGFIQVQALDGGPILRLEQRPNTNVFSLADGAVMVEVEQELILVPLPGTSLRGFAGIS